MEETENLGFFKRVKISIFNLEKYKIFTQETFSKALKYLFILLLISTFLLSIAATIQMVKQTNKLINYIKTDFPEFTLENDKLSVEKKVTSYDEEYDAKLIADTSEELTDEEIESYKKEAKSSALSVILLNDKVIYKTGNTILETYETTYSNFTSLLGKEKLTKEKLVNDYLNNNNIIKIKVLIFIFYFITILIVNFIDLMEGVIIVALFGWIASKISRVKVSFYNAASLAIYSLTLSIILSTIYNVSLTFTNFEIKYFSVMYMLIAYIYMVASIMIMKEDLNKTAGEAVTVEGQVIKTDSENETEEEKPEDKKDKEKKKEKKEELPEEEVDKNNEKNTLEKNKKEKAEDNKEEKK